MEKVQNNTEQDVIECFNCGEKSIKVHIELMTKQMLCETCIEKAMAVILTNRHELVNWINEPND